MLYQCQKHEDIRARTVHTEREGERRHKRGDLPPFNPVPLPTIRAIHDFYLQLQPSSTKVLIEMSPMFFAQ